ncbi:MAG TPA: hypothetical protein VFQ61_27290 [Polyangiaceae bacterium]|nr:hypothetical protein [Polyangiaceae bacterium]
MTGLDPNAAVSSAEPIVRPSATRSVSFRAVAVVFLGLLVLGLGLAVWVHKRYVAYQPTAARHVASDAVVALRLDLTHVMFYEPFRRALLPLVDLGPSGAHRAERLAERGLRASGDVREIVVASRAELGSLSVVLGGTFERRGVTRKLAEVLRGDGIEVLASSGELEAFCMTGGPCFAQFDDGSIAFAQHEQELLAVRAATAAPPALVNAAGGFFLRGREIERMQNRVAQAVGGSTFRADPDWASVERLELNFRAGSVVELQLKASLTDESRGRAAIERTLAELAHDAPEFDSQKAQLRLEGRELSGRFRLPRESVERLFSRLAEVLKLL